MTLSVTQLVYVLVGVSLTLYGLWQVMPAVKLPAWPASKPSGPTLEQDRQTVLAIAGRLVGNPKAVSLCEQLLHEMLRGPGAPSEPERRLL